MKTTSYVAVVSVFMKNDMDVSENSGTLKSSILIGFSITFTIHFGGPPLFWGTHPYHAPFSWCCDASYQEQMPLEEQQAPGKWKLEFPRKFDMDLRCTSFFWRICFF